MQFVTALTLAFLAASSTLALARGGSHGGGPHAAAGMNSAAAPAGGSRARAPAVAASASAPPAAGAPAFSGAGATAGPSSTALGGAPNPYAPFNPSGVGVPGGSGPGNTTVYPDTTPPAVRAGSLGNGMVNYPSSLSTAPTASPPGVTPAQ